MKKSFILGLFLTAILVFLAFGEAASAASITLDKMVIEDTKKPTAGFSHQFVIRNNGTENITDLRIERVGPALNGFNISTLPHSLGSVFALNSGAQVQFSLTGKIPKDVTTKEVPYTDMLKIYSGSTELGSINLKITAQSQMELDNVKFVVDGKSKGISEGDTRKEVLPGSKLEIKGDIKNMFTRDEDIDMEDVTVEVTIENLDDGEDMDADVDVGDLKRDDKENFKVEFSVPLDIDADEYGVRIYAEGEDINGAKHSVEWDDIQIKVEKDNHDVMIVKAAASPSKIGCSRNVNIEVKLKNQGTSDEEEVVVLIENEELGMSYEDSSIPELAEGTGEDTEYSRAYPFKIDDSVKPGTYIVNVKAYYDTDVESDSKNVELIVQNCEAEKAENAGKEGASGKGKDEVVVVVNPPKEAEGSEIEEEIREEPEVLTAPITETTESSLFQSNTYLFLLAGAAGTAVIVLIIMVVVLFSMKRRD